MAHEPSPPSPGLARLGEPRFLAAGGVALNVLAWLLASAITGLPALVTLFLVLAAVVLSVAAVSRQLSRLDWSDSVARLHAATLTSLVGLGFLAAYAAMDKEWDSAHMALGALFLLSLFGAVLIVLNSLSRRIALSLILVFHFGGMVTTITSVDPPGGQGPWVSKQLWAWVYRPYLSFLYLTNAYHFYSPDPGPPALLWFAVHYTDDTYIWVKLPERSTSANGMHYQRRLALPEHTFSATNRLPLTEAEKEIYQARTGRSIARDSWNVIVERRMLGSSPYAGYKPKKNRIPWVVDIDTSLQYREPNEESKKIIASVAKRIFWTAPKPDDPNVKVLRVKAYRVVHRVLTPGELAEGGSPLDKTKHWGWFLGEFDGNGKIHDETDPFLYWYLPIIYVPNNYPDGNYEGPALKSGERLPGIRVNDPPPKKNRRLLDCLEIHAAGKSNAKPQKEGE